jgi:hypothetical protein
MREVARVLFIVVALLALSLAVGAQAPEKWARGTITAVGTDTVTLEVKGQPMTFKVAPTTDVVARGAGTKARETKATSGRKPTVAEVLKVGEHVEVRYTEAEGVMTAALIRGGVSATDMTSDEAAKGTSSKAEGIVTSVTSTSIGIKSADGTEATFTADEKIRVVGRGLGTMSREKGAMGAKLTLTDAVAVGDTVSIAYKETGGAKQATTVTLVKKGT